MHALPLLVVGQGLAHAEASLVNAVGDAVDLGAEVVEHDDGDAGTGDTEGRVDQGLGDTGGELGGIGRAGGGHGAERPDHSKHGSDKAQQRADARAGGQDHQVLAEHGELQGRGLFDLLLHGVDLGLLVQGTVVQHGLVLLQAAAHHVGHAALLFVAGGDGFIHAVGGQQLAHVVQKGVDAALALGAAQGDEALDGENEHQEHNGEKDGHNEAALVDDAERVVRVQRHRMAFYRITSLEVGRIAQHEHVEQDADDQSQGKGQSHEQAGDLSGLLGAHVEDGFVVEVAWSLVRFSFWMDARRSSGRGGRKHSKSIVFNNRLTAALVQVAPFPFRPKATPAGHPAVCARYRCPSNGCDGRGNGCGDWTYGRPMRGLGFATMVLICYGYIFHVNYICA